jgi:hypothetical protein
MKRAATSFGDAREDPEAVAELSRTKPIKGGRIN